MLPDIPGEKVEDRNMLEQLRERAAELLHKMSNSHRFPGAQPVSFSKIHIKSLTEDNYFVSEKADGIRVMIFTHCDMASNVRQTFLVDRKNDYYYLNCGFPMPENRGYHTDTLMDGELVIESGKRTYLLLFDLMVIDGTNICSKGYSSRLGVLIC